MEDGTQAYCARFQLGRMQATELIFDLPGPASLLHPEVLLNGKGLANAGTPAGGSADKELHVRLGDKSPGRGILEVTYKLPPALASGSSNWHTALQPPVPRNCVILGRARWLAELPSKWVAVYQQGSLPGSTAWVWRRGLFAPEPNAAAIETLLR